MTQYFASKTNKELEMTKQNKKQKKGLKGRFGLRLGFLGALAVLALSVGGFASPALAQVAGDACTAEGEGAILNRLDNSTTPNSYLYLVCDGTNWQDYITVDGDDGDILVPALKLDVVTGQPAPTYSSGAWALSGSNIFYDTGLVGIGINAPTSQLHVQGNSLFDGAARVNGNLNVDTNGGLIIERNDGAYDNTLAYFGITSQGGDNGLWLGMSDNNGSTYTPFYFSATGKFGIGTAAPTENLDVAGTVHLGSSITNFTLELGSNGSFISSDADQFVVNRHFNTNTHEVRTNGGNIELGGGTVNGASDMRKKENITLISNALSKVLKLRGVLFDWKDEFVKGNMKKSGNIGVIAQEVEAVFPEAVVTDDSKEGYKSVSYALLVAPIIEAIKELWSQVQTKDSELELRIAELEARLEALENE